VAFHTFPVPEFSSPAFSSLAFSAPSPTPYNDMLVAADALCLLDLTAAFDTVDHTLLLDRLECQFGLRENVLEWFRSYLSDRIFRVTYGGNTSLAVVIFIGCHRVSIALLWKPCTSYDRDVCLSVCPSVCHTLILCENDASYDHEIFTG